MDIPSLKAAVLRAGQDATLPEGYRWGHDAMEQFEVGKRQATLAILELMDGLAKEPPD